MRSRLGFPAVAVLFLLLLLSTLANAAYVTNMPTELKQPDGTVIACFASGDEYYNWAHDADGFVIIQHPDTGWWVYATASNGSVVPTEYVVGTVDPEAVGLQPNVRPSASRIMERRLSRIGLSPSGAEMEPAPKTGTVNNIVIFIRFSDDAEYTDTVTAYDTIFNSTDPAVSSLRNYFTDTSYSKLTVSTTLYPTPTGTTIISYQDSHPRSYYMPYNATTNPGGYQSNESTSREHTLLMNAINAVKAQIPPDLNVDSDNDGNVDNVCFVVKGGSTAWGTLLWPHMWVLYSNNTTINNKRVWGYNFQQSSWLMPSGVGVLAHEMMHTLGAPDLYHYTDNGIDPMGAWDVMCGNSNPPQHTCSYMKYKYMKWISTLPQITTSGTYTLNPLSSATGNCYKIASPNSTKEFFVVEYRNKLGKYEGRVPAKGLVVYRINTVANGNSNGPPDEIYIYRPNGTTTTNGSIGTANFSSGSGRTAINDTTNPSCFLANGSAGGLNISNVGAAGDTISFTVSFLPTYTVTASAGTGGSISPSGVTTTTQGNNLTYTITASSGYEIADVLVDNVSVGAVASYTFTNVTADHTITANFSPSPIVLTGKVTDQSNGAVIAGATVYLSLSANPSANPTYTVTTDASGNYSQLLPVGTWYGAAAKAAYDTSADKTIVVSVGSTPILNFALALTPIPGTDVFYKFDESSGTVASESSGSGITGTLVNDPAWTAGREGNCLAFDGSNDYVSVPNLGDYSAITVAGWINLDALGTDATGSAILACDGSEAGDVQLLILRATGRMRFSLIGNTAADLDSNYAFTSADFGKWRHVAAVYDSRAKTVRFYINGGLNATKTLTTARLATLSNGVRVGGWSGGRYFDGKIDEFHIYGRALSGAEIAGIVNSSPSMKISDAKKLANGELVTLANKIVTYAPRNASGARSTNYFYIEDADRSAGLMIHDGSTGQDSMTADTPATVSGIMRTITYTGQRYLELSAIPGPGTAAAVNPLGMVTKAIYGDPLVTGLLVRVTGKVKEISPDNDWFTITDGSVILSAASPAPGVSSSLPVRQVTPVVTAVISETGVPISGISVGDIVTATGALGKDILFGTAPEGIVYMRSVVKL